MIRLDVEDYCQDCRAFEPETDTNALYSINGEFNGEFSVETVITCERRNWCKNLVRYLKKQLEKVGDTDGDHR